MTKKTTFFNSALFLTILLFVFFLLIQYGTKIELVASAIGISSSFDVWWHLFSAAGLCISLCFGVLILISYGISFIHAKSAQIFLFSASSLISLLILLDIKLFTLTGNHIFDEFVINGIRNGALTSEVNLGTATYIFGIGIALLFFLAPYLIQYILTKFLKTSSHIFIQSILPILILIFSVVFFATATKKPILQQAYIWPQFAKPHTFSIESKSQMLELYTMYAQKEDYKLEDKKNILFIVLESFRGDLHHLTPHINYLSETYGTHRSSYHYSGTNTTETSVFSLLYGIHGLNYALFANHKTPSLPLQILSSAGYDLQGFSASRLRGWNNSDFLLDQFNSYIEYTEWSDWRSDSVTVEEFLSAYSQRCKDTPHFYFVFLHSTHHNYYFPPTFEIHTPVISQNYNHFLGDDTLFHHRESIFNRYKNSMMYVDYLLEKITAGISDDLDNDLILVITGDHAEEFWENGLLGHGASNLYNSRTLVPLVFHVPGKEKQTHIASGHSHIFPTIFSYLTPNFDIQPFVDAPALGAHNNTVLISANDFMRTGRLCLVSPPLKQWLTFKDSELHLTRTFTLEDADTTHTTLPTLVEREIMTQIGKYFD